MGVGKDLDCGAVATLSNGDKVHEADIVLNICIIFLSLLNVIR